MDYRKGTKKKKKNRYKNVLRIMIHKIKIKNLTIISQIISSKFIKFKSSIKIKKKERNLTMMSLGIKMGPSSGVPHIALGQEHVPIIRLATVAFEPSDRIRHAILALGEA